MSRKNRSAAQWQEIITLFEQSNLTVTEFCREYQVSHSGFYHWRKRLTSEPKAEVTEDNWQPVNLPKVQTVNTSSPEWDIELTLPNGITLRMRQ
ncbi:transposase [Shewanella sp. 202IG2-18]|uniref:IS66 family insertion sequence element accessory protein TnpA n=1 Tax=Parashewanella hymeniacidonis TaxID=2807618 RepID=UPI00196037D7|nr:transposase [Parashewanella hymeniacidonis]MBM7074658.1 transposase [Parashewanella hymeniacidonis]